MAEKPDPDAMVPASPSEIIRSRGATKKRARALAKSIEGLKHDAQKVQQVSRHEIEEVAEKYSRSPSTFLAGVLGGAIGSAGGIALGTLGTGLIVVSGPIGLVIGAAVGVLAFRGRSYWRLEKATQKARGALDFVRGEINALPHDAPKDVREHLYRQYLTLAAEYSRVAHDSIDDAPRQVALPDPSRKD